MAGVTFVDAARAGVVGADVGMGALASYKTISRAGADVVGAVGASASGVGVDALVGGSIGADAGLPHANVAAIMAAIARCTS